MDYPEEFTNENGYPVHIHDHPLLLIENESNSDTATTSTSVCKSVSLHNPVKRIKLLCNACVRPITTMPFYKCSKEGECSNFVLHVQCNKIPTRRLFPYHEHLLDLCLDLILFICKICDLPSSGFAYKCDDCLYQIDVNCAFIPKNITHEAHPGHVLSIMHHDKLLHDVLACRACHIGRSGELFYKCNSCEFCLHLLCALNLPKIVRHKYDRHTLNLSYSPIENHKGQYFCEVCEENLDPDTWFYHCSKCAQSIHSACSPLILKSEQELNSSKEDFVYKFLNVKFGVEISPDDHEHSMLVLLGTKSDGDCTRCGHELQSQVICKCFECKFRIHIYCIEFHDSDEDVNKEAEIFLDKFRNRQEPDIKPQPQRSVAFYPKSLLRPTTS